MAYALKPTTGVYNFSFDLTDLIGAATIVSSAWTSTPTGLTLDNSSISGKVTTVYATGGTAGVDYTVVNTVVTSADATEVKTFTLKVEAPKNGA
jgi:hypothetical protein